MIDLSPLFLREYHPEHYHCGHFTRDVWLALTGQDIAQQVECFLRPERYADMSLRQQFVRLDAPVSPCIVLCKNLAGQQHAGVYYLGNVYHLTQTGASGHPLALALHGYSDARFYQCAK